MIAKRHSGNHAGLKLPDTRKTLTQETCPDLRSNPGPLRDRRACYRLLYRGGLDNFEVLKLKDEDIKLQIRVQISNRLMYWELVMRIQERYIRYNIKVTAGESIDYCGEKKRKPWFDNNRSSIIERRKQAKLNFLQDPTQLNRDNHNNERCDTSRTLRSI